MSRLRNQLVVGDVRTVLPAWPADSVDCVVTSPPYYRLRDYGPAAQIGLEPTVGDWVDELRRVMHEIARVLTPSGSVWLNLGDAFSHHERDGALPKSLLLGPERLAIALAADGWVIRSKVIWAKTNPQPTSVRDRLTCTWEVLYLLVRSRRYYFDLDAIRVPHRSHRTRLGRTPKRQRTPSGRPAWAGPLAGSNSGLDRMKARGLVGHPLGKNPGDVWPLATSSLRGIHHATFPLSLLRQPLLASCPERVCVACNAPWQRQRASSQESPAALGLVTPDCTCNAPSRPGLVLDPFIGAGTVAVAAEALGRDWLGIELNPAFADQALQRIADARAQHSRDPPVRAAA